MGEVGCERGGALLLLTGKQGLRTMREVLALLRQVLQLDRLLVHKRLQGRSEQLHRV